MVGQETPDSARIMEAVDVLAGGIPVPTLVEALTATNIGASPVDFGDAAIRPGQAAVEFSTVDFSDVAGGRDGVALAGRMDRWRFRMFVVLDCVHID